MSEPWWISVIKAVIVINLVLFGFAYLTLIERKVMGRMQLRYGPNRAGPYGLLQPIADLVKLLRKESFFPTAAIDVLYIFSPFIAAFTALTTFSVIPWGEGWTIAGYHVNGYVADVPISLILIFAIGSIGDLRLHHRRLVVRLEVRAARVDAHVRAARLVRGLARALRARRRPDGAVALTRRHRRRPGRGTWWYVVPQFVGFVIFLLAGTAETARAPFDLPEAEQELVAGYHTEYGGMRFGLFSMSEYINLITLSGLCVTLFLGGWHFFFWDFLGPLWFILKLAVLIFVFIWMRDDAAAAPLRPADALRLEGAPARGDDQRRRHGRPRRLDRLMEPA